MARNVAAWTKLECEGAEVAFRQHWGGLVEVACGECRVMVCYCGLERLTKLPPESAHALLLRLLQQARSEKRNRIPAETLSAVLERALQDRQTT